MRYAAQANRVSQQPQKRGIKNAPVAGEPGSDFVSWSDQAVQALLMHSTGQTAAHCGES